MDVQFQLASTSHSTLKLETCTKQKSKNIFVPIYTEFMGKNTLDIPLLHMCSTQTTKVEATKPKATRVNILHSSIHAEQIDKIHHQTH